MEKFWTQFYPVEVPKELPPSEFKSLNEFFDKKFAEFADLPFTSNMGVTLSYAQVNEYAQAVSAWLQSIGLAKGSTVALMMPNVHQYLPVLVAIVRAGYVLNTVNPLYTARELKHRLNDADAKAIIILENFCHTLAPIVDETPLQHIVISKLGDMLGTLKGAVVNLTAKYAKKVIPDYHIASTPNRSIIALKQVIKQGQHLDLGFKKANVISTCQTNP